MLLHILLKEGVLGDVWGDQNKTKKNNCLIKDLLGKVKPIDPKHAAISSPRRGLFFLPHISGRLIPAKEPKMIKKTKIGW